MELQLLQRNERSAAFGVPRGSASAMNAAEADSAGKSRAGWRSWLSRAGAVAFGVGLFLGCLHLYTRSNDFTYEYHADEPGKARQILTGDRNYNHPQLLLEFTWLATRLWETPEDRQAVVETGRWASAVFTATAVAALAWVGYSIAGWIGLLLVGAVVGLSPQLLTYAHYMKEDAALIGGVALTVLASRLIWISGTTPWGRTAGVALLGIGCAAAVSGKYVGIVALALAIPVTLLAPGTRGVMRVIWPGVMIAYFLTATLAINHRIFDDYERFRASLDREAEHAVTHHTQITMDRPNTFFLARFPEETMPHVRVLAGVYLVLLAGKGVRMIFAEHPAGRLRKIILTPFPRPLSDASGRGDAGIGTRRRGDKCWDVMIVLFAGLFLFVLSMSVIPFNRYFLPVAMMTYLFAGMGAAWAIELIGGRRIWLKAVLTTAAVTAVVIVQGTRCLNYIDQFRDDSRARLRVWMAEHIPPGTRVVQDSYAHLHRRGDHRDGQAFDRPRVRLERQRGMFAPSAGSLERLRRRGVEYAVVCDLSYRRFFHAQVKGFEGREELFEQRKGWYETLFEEYELVWSSEPEHPMYAFTNPTIRVYRLTPRPDEPRPDEPRPDEPRP